MLKTVMWLGLIALSLAIALLLEWVKLPAAFLLGPMLAGIIFAAGGLSAGAREIQLPRTFFELAQAVVGTMIAGQIPAETLVTVAHDWPVFLAGVIMVILASALLGYVLARRQVLPGNTAVWGASPGAAQAMIFLAEAYGADMRLVAVMQYLRVVMVAAGASIIARLVHAEADAASAVIWFPAPDLAFVHALVIMAVGLALAYVTRMPAGTFLLPLLLGAFAAGMGWLDPALPDWVLALAFAAIGWMIGLRFSRDILIHAARAMPRLVVAIALLILMCAGMAVLLVVFAGVDPLTAFLATSPGGADSIAIIAASSQADMAFVMAMQTMRFIVVLATGPAIARIISARLTRQTI